MLYKYQGNRIEDLAEDLACLLRIPAGDPLDPETIIVQSNGMARWLSLVLARKLNVACNLRFPYPAAFQWQIYRQHLPEVPDSSPFERSVLAWRIMARLSARHADPVFGPISRYLAGKSPLQAYELARRVADTFDQYLVYRPDWIEAWERGEGDHWQAQLWRDLVASTEVPHRVALWKVFEAAMADLVTRSRLPGRIVVFGISSLAPQLLDWLAGLARLTDVHFFLLNPCREAWGHILDERQIARLSESGDAAALHLESGNGLLALLGKQGRDYLDLVIEMPGIEIESFQEPPGTHLLARLQRNMLTLRDDEDDAEPISRQDTSLQIHACHSPLREVEVLHDQLLALLEADPGLELSDIIVMTPNIDRYAPFIDAVFGTAQGAARLAYSIADRSYCESCPLTQLLLGLLRLPQGRHEAETILGLLAQEAVLARFELTVGDLDRIRNWVRETNIRWGLDGSARERLGLPGHREHTWAAGIERMALGYFLPTEAAGHPWHAPFAGIVPLEGIEGQQVLVLGRFLQFVRQIRIWEERLRRPMTAEAWSEALQALLDSFIQPSADNEETLVRIRRTIHRLGRTAAEGGYTADLSPDTVEAWLLANLDDDRATGFLHGQVTFCAMIPMRAIPFRVVCLLGLNDGDFPRIQKPFDFDLMADDFRRGDRSRREDDRYLFLEALLSARQCLYLSYIGRSIRDNSVLPPSVVVADLVDYVVRNFVLEGEGEMAAHLVLHHPLQAFNPAYFSGSGRLVSYSPLYFATSRQAASNGRTRSPFWDTAIPVPVELSPDLPLEALLRFWARPVRYFLRERLKIRLEALDDSWEICEPFSIDSRSRQAILALRVAQQISGDLSADLVPVLRGQGLLPHGRAGDLLLRPDLAQADAFAGRLAGILPAGRPTALPFDIDLSGYRLTGRLEGVVAEGIVDHAVARLRGGLLLRTWIHHLILCHLQPAGVSLTSRLLTLDDEVVLGPVPDPLPHLQRLVDGYRAGQAEPLPFFPRASYQYALARKAGKEAGEALNAARKLWEPSDYTADGGGVPSEGEDPWHALAFRDRDPLGAAFEEWAWGVFGDILQHAGRPGETSA